MEREGGDDPILVGRIPELGKLETVRGGRIWPPIGYRSALANQRAAGS